MRQLWWGAVMLLFLGMPVAQAATQSIAINNPALVQAGNVYVLNAQLQFEMPPGAEQAIRDGATMNLLLDIRFEQVRRFWLNSTLAELQQRYALSYHSVSQRFLVRNLNSGEQTSHESFMDAVDSFRNISALPVMDMELLKPNNATAVAIHAATEVRTIPRVLHMLLFWVDDYALQSDWYQWPLRP